MLTNWQSVRLKHPLPNGKAAWRVEFRTIEVSIVCVCMHACIVCVCTHACVSVCTTKLHEMYARASNCFCKHLVYSCMNIGTAILKTNTITHR